MATYYSDDRELEVQRREDRDGSSIWDCRLEGDEDERARFEGEVEVTPVGDEWFVRLDGHAHRCVVRRDATGSLAVWVGGHVLRPDVLTSQERRRKLVGGSGADDGGSELVSPMAGKVVTVLVTEGEEVERGDGLIIVEAMKMENELKATRGGRISAVLANDGATVEIGEVLIRFEEEEE